MALSFAQQQQQAQLQKLTPQLIQSVELLQYNQAELERFLLDQAERNPFLDVKLPGDGGQGSPRAQTPVPRPISGSSRSTGAEDLPEFAAVIPAPVNLREHLHGQLGLAFRDPLDHAIAVEIIGSLDDDGYLRRDIGNIAEAMRATSQQVETVLREVQKMDPPGIAARDLRECLRLQLMDKGWLTLAMDVLVDHLDLLASHDYKRLASLCKVDPPRILEMAERIRSLDPRPGLQFDREPLVPALPDVLVRQMEDGSFLTELNGRVLPRVLVNGQYTSRIRANCSGPEDTKFVTECLRNANWLVRNLDQRAQTILRVATEIVRHQQKFLQHGVEHLRPLNLRDVAETIGVHPSTVCRAIANKYMLTDRGLFELGYFFANAIGSVDGEGDVATDAVRHAIRQLIANEPPDDVLSDDAIVHRLHANGIDIARRTVAKYREAMNIPSSLRRRRLKQAQRKAAAA